MIGPSDILEKTIKVITLAFRTAGIDYWLGFGGLWGLVQNGGVIPDDDLDFCTFYGANWKRLKQVLESRGYTMTKALQNDADPENVLYMGFNKKDWPHICVSFWYPHNGIRYYCHDQNFEVTNGSVGVPASGYYFKGIPESCLQEFRYVEWPGIVQNVKVRVPRFPGAILDHCYPDWGYIKQRYTISHEHQIDPDKTISVFKGGAVSPYMVHVKSMHQWSDSRYINQQIEAGRQKWLNRLKALASK
jgi:hypothetical protein